MTVDDGEYTQEILIAFQQDNIRLLDNISEGDRVTVNFDLRGLEYYGRYFNVLVGLKIEPADGVLCDEDLQQDMSFGTVFGDVDGERLPHTM